MANSSFHKIRSLAVLPLLNNRTKSTQFSDTKKDMKDRYSLKCHQLHMVKDEEINSLGQLDPMISSKYALAESNII